MAIAGNEAWKMLLAVPGSFLGPMTRPQSAEGVQLFLRWVLLRHLKPLMQT